MAVHFILLPLLAVASVFFNDHIWSTDVRRSSSKNVFAEFACCIDCGGHGLWLVNRYLPMASSIKTILNVVVVVAVGVFVLKSV
jgi:hypothetical protein